MERYSQKANFRGECPGSTARPATGTILMKESEAVNGEAILRFLYRKGRLLKAGRECSRIRTKEDDRTSGKEDRT